MSTKLRRVYPKTYLPNHLPFGRLAFVRLVRGNPDASVFQRLSATQIVGGSTWSLAIVRIGPYQHRREKS